MDETHANAIDLFKLVFAICIMGIHTHALNLFPEAVQYYGLQMVFRLGVPYFFVTSGYFFGKKLVKETTQADRIHTALVFSKKMIPPFCVWGGAGLLWEICICIVKRESVRIFEIVHDFVFYPLGAMWFLLACAIAAIIIAVLYNHEHVLLLLALTGYLFALLANTYYFFIEDTFFQTAVDQYMFYFVSARNGFFVGLPLFGAGVFLCRHDIFLFKNKAFITGCLLLSLLIYTFEVIMTREKNAADDRALYFSSIVVGIALLLVARQLVIPYTYSFSVKLRIVSKYIFYLHPFYNAYFGAVLFHITNNGMIQFCYVCACCVATYLIATQKGQRLFKVIIP